MKRQIKYENCEFLNDNDIYLIFQQIACGEGMPLLSNNNQIRKAVADDATLNSTDSRRSKE